MRKLYLIYRDPGAIERGGGKEKKEPLKGEVDQTQIDQWKAAHPNGIYAATCEGHIMYLKKPDQKILAYAASKVTEEGFMDYHDAIYSQTRIGGVKKEDVPFEVYQGMARVIRTVSEVKLADLVNL